MGKLVRTCSLVLRDAILMLPTSNPDGDDPRLLGPAFFSAATWAATWRTLNRGP